MTAALDDTLARTIRDENEAAQLPDADPEAPYGRRADGRPYTMSPQARAARGAALAAARSAAAGRRGNAPRMKAPARKASSGKGSTDTIDYRMAIAGLLQVPAFMLAMGARLNPVLALDSAALTLHTPTIVEALNETALVDERLAALLDRVLAVGPYGVLLAALVPLGMQIAANHGVMPANPEMGVLTAEQLMEEVTKLGKS